MNIKMEEEQTVKGLSSTIKKRFFRRIRIHRENYIYPYFLRAPSPGRWRGTGTGTYRYRRIRTGSNIFLVVSMTKTSEKHARFEARLHAQDEYSWPEQFQVSHLFSNTLLNKETLYNVS